MVFSMLVCVNLCRSGCTCKVSNDFETSIAIVVSGNFFMWNLVVIVLCIVCSAVIVECFV